MFSSSVILFLKFTPVVDEGNDENIFFVADGWQQTGTAKNKTIKKDKQQYRIMYNLFRQPRRGQFFYHIFADDLALRNADACRFGIMNTTIHTAHSRFFGGGIE